MGNQTELRHFRYFLAVAEELHFRKAADKLYISQPGLSRQIKQMEEHLGVLLFERNNKTVSLTPAGLYLKKELRLVLKNIDDITAQAKMLTEGKEGIINLGYVGAAMQNVIPNLMLSLRKMHPKLRFNLAETNNAAQVNALLSQQIDLGFVRLNQVPKELRIEPVWRETFSLVLPEDHPINEKNFKDLSQLAAEPFIFFDKSYSSIYHARVMSIFEAAGFSPNISHNTVHANTIFRLVENKFGISIVPTSLQLGYQLKIKFIELKKIPQRAVLFMAWNPKSRNPALGKLLDVFEGIGFDFERLGKEV